MRSIALLLVLCSPLAADVAVLKDGRKISGRVVDKVDHYEVTTDVGLRTFLKEEVDHIAANPKEFLGDTEKLYEEAKIQFKRAKELDPGSVERNSILKDALAKLKVARDALALTRELFPEDRFADLDQKLVLVMQLTRMLRGEVTHENDRPSEIAIDRPAASIPLPAGLDGAFSTLADPARRSNKDLREKARETFRSQRARHPAIYELSTAAMIFLSKTDQEWRLQGGAGKALQDYFAKPWITEPLRQSPADNLRAATYLAEQITAVRKVDPGASVEPLALFGMGHLGQAPPGQETERTARQLGLVVKDGIAGSAEGHVLRDLGGWIAAGDYDLAVTAWVKEYRAVDTPAVRYVWSYALLRLAQQNNRGYERPVRALGGIQTSSPALREHLGALGRSIKAAGTCGVCSGEGKIRCTNCHGRKETRIVCRDCAGTGRKKQSSGHSLENCPRCKSTGCERLIRCEKCKDGFNDCRQCDRKPHAAPALEDICTMTPCAECDGRGCAFRKVSWPCPGCMGVGQRLVPKADPAKVIRG